MKKIVLALVLALAPAGMAVADNDIGCGVGTQVMKNQKGLLPHLMGSFTNGLTFQSISITFGVMGCNGRDTVTADAQLRKFAAGNFDRLARDMASGEGESLEAFAMLLGVQESDRADFYAFTQAHFSDLFASDQTTSSEMVDTLDRLLAADERLAGYARG